MAFLQKTFEYHLKISTHLLRFESEIKYAFNYVNQLYDLKFNDKAERVFRYGGANCDVPGSFFEEFVSLTSAGIFLRPKSSSGLETLWPKLPSNGQTAKFQFDSIGFIFFMLSRVEERSHASLDNHERFLSASSFVVKKNWLHIPVADVFARFVAFLITGSRRTEASQYTVKLTHDVDRLKAYHYPLEPIRYALGDLLKRNRGLAALKRFEAYKTNEPWASVNALTALSEKYHLKSHFYFMGPTSLRMDSPYCKTMKSLLSDVVATIIDNGHLVGFHPGYATFNNSHEFAIQKSGLESVAGINVSEGRQHVIRYDCATTPRIWESNKMRKDYSLFYPDRIGFRNGSCHSFPTYDLVSRSVLKLQQTATAIAEFALLDDRYNNYGVDLALEICSQVIEQAKEFNGELVVLFHTHQLDRPQWNFYNKLLPKLL